MLYMYANVCEILAIAPGPFSSFPHPVLSQDSQLYGLHQVGPRPFGIGQRETQAKDQRQEKEVGSFSLLFSLLNHGSLSSGHPQFLFRGPLLKLHVSLGSEDHPLPLHLFPTIASPHHPITVPLKLTNTFLNEPLLQSLF